jgi:hypothetical protein
VSFISASVILDLAAGFIVHSQYYRKYLGDIMCYKLLYSLNLLRLNDLFISCVIFRSYDTYSGI